MKGKKQKILVPVDFTEVSDCAIEHAKVFAKITGYSISLLHVIEKPTMFLSSKSFNNELLEKETVDKLNNLAGKVEEQGLKCEIIAKPGNIFDTINEVSSEIGANLVIMGTHGVKGLQHLTGSNALRVVYHSEVPFIIVQTKNPESHYDNVVFPIDFKRETKEKVVWAIYLAKIFKSKIHILLPKENDEYILKKVKSNLSYAKKVFNQNHVSYDVKCSDLDTDDLYKDINGYAKEISANLIMIMTSPASGAGEFFLTPDQQNIITNVEGTPVMCVNPREGMFFSADAVGTGTT